MNEIVLLSCLIFSAAVLYSSVGQAGDSGFRGDALHRRGPDVMKPSALVLNILAAGVGAIRFWRAGHR
jgi:hypothetical protein